ncbi:MAG: tRNA lysidine(34) synthetase TilS [Lachnospiraceae bacterium]|nr:tRNA lysidine(34) synthetase TilS [Lachnospiraceae bacterium]
MSDLKDQMKQFIKDNNMIRQRDTVVLGLSGGGDSVCLFLLLKDLQEELSFRLKTVTVDHGIRGEDGRRDAKFAEALSIQYNVPCRTVTVDAPALAREKNLSLEEAARILRYEALQQAAGKDGVIAVAHHAMDQAETVLYRLIRGSGPKGLSGMQPVSQMEGHRLIRPLLSTMPQEIYAYLKERQQAYCSDVTNEDVSYARNRIRKNVLPELEQINPKAVLHICQAAQKLRGVGDARRSIDDYLIKKDEGEMESALHIPAILKEEEQVRRRILFAYLEKEMPHMRDVTAKHVELLEELLTAGTGKRVNLPYGMQAVVAYEKLFLQKEEDKTAKDWELQVPLLEEGELWSVSTNRWEIRMKRRAAKPEDTRVFPRKNYTKWFDYDKIKNGLSLRTRRNGDSFVIDEGSHRRKIKDYFIDEKIPRHERDEILLLASGDNVYWILGRRTAFGCGIDTKTKEILEISIHRND